MQADDRKTEARTALVTGAAGFVGFHVARRLLAEGWTVIGYDAMTPYYDVALKRSRVELLLRDGGFEMIEARLEERGRITDLMTARRPDLVVHLAAQAGVRYSLEDPRSYVDSNLVGTLELLEAARAAPPSHLLMASTSSVFGANTKMPYAETDKADTPMSFYAATKKANEAMSHAYAHLFGVPVTMFRFFTVYGPWGRPDMAAFLFVDAIRSGRPIDVFNNGEMVRDFTYIGDLVEAIHRLIPVAPPSPDGRGPALAGDSLSPVAPWRVVNIGQSRPVALKDFIAAIERALGMTAEKRFLPMQPGDVPATWADTSLLTALVGDIPEKSLDEGLQAFVAWYDDYGKTMS
jgi:UDP-glucuronate 4-epimerase